VAMRHIGKARATPSESLGKPPLRSPPRPVWVIITARWYKYRAFDQRQRFAAGGIHQIILPEHGGQAVPCIAGEYGDRLHAHHAARLPCRHEKKRAGCAAGHVDTMVMARRTRAAVPKHPAQGFDKRRIVE